MLSFLKKKETEEFSHKTTYIRVYVYSIPCFYEKISMSAIMEDMFRDSLSKLRVDN